jgi:phosphoglycolate phosphatase
VIPSERPFALPAAAVFDWDGTLADSLAAILRAERAVMRDLGVDLPAELLRTTYTPDWRAKYRSLGIPEERWPEAARNWSERMLAARPRAFPWARRALRSLRRRGVLLALVTASGRSIVEPNLVRLNLGGAFEDIVCADDVTHTKPHPEGLERALTSMRVLPGDAVYVGDTIIDLAMARAAGVPFVPIGGTIPDHLFHAEEASPVWPSVAAWAEDLLAEDSRPASPGRLASARRRGRD